MDEDLLNQTNKKWIKSGDLIVDCPASKMDSRRRRKDTAKKYGTIFSIVKA
jgi:molybdopterin/thiamine biosynthesis adenylyltransferase